MSIRLPEMNGAEAKALLTNLLDAGTLKLETLESLLAIARTHTRAEIALATQEPLLGKVALVTGSSRGIGKATALELGKMGANVVVTFKTNQAKADDVVQQLETISRRSVAMKFDMNDESSVDQLFDQVETAFNHQLDIFVANACTSAFKPIVDLKPRHFEMTYQGNITNFVMACQRAAKIMTTQGGGKIVALSSITADNVLENMGLMASAKAAIDSITRYMAVEFAPAGINVNTVVPGIVSTDSTLYYAEHGASEGYLAAAKHASLQKRLVSPEEVAAVIAFLCTDGANGIVGQRLVVDGGLTLKAL